MCDLDDFQKKWERRLREIEARDRATKNPRPDMVEVVRCKDCKHSVPSETNKGYLYCRRIYACRQPEHFCSYGERKDGASDG